MYHLTGIRRTFLRVPPVLALFAIPFGVYLQRFRYEHGFVAELAAPAEQLMVWICVAVVLQLFYRLIRRESRTVSTAERRELLDIPLPPSSSWWLLVLALLPLPLGALPKFLAVVRDRVRLAAMLHLVFVRRIRSCDSSSTENGRGQRADGARPSRPRSSPAARSEAVRTARPRCRTRKRAHRSERWALSVLPVPTYCRLLLAYSAFKPGQVRRAEAICFSPPR